MAKSFKFRYVNEITGAFVLLTLVAVIAGILLAGNAQKWFEPVYRITLTFPPEGAYGLQKGAEVRILGTLVGLVEEITVDDKGGMKGMATIRGNFIRFVRADSLAVVKKKFAVAGDAYIEITKGEGAELPADQRVLECRRDTEIIEMIADVVQQVKKAAVPALEKVQLAVEEYTKLATELQRPDGNLQQLLANLNRLAEDLQKGEGTAGKLLKDPALADELNGILEDIKKTTANLPKMADTVGGEVNDLPGTVFQAQETLRETKKLIEALQKHWLIRGYVDVVEPSERIPPEEVGVSSGGRP